MPSAITSNRYVRGTLDKFKAQDSFGDEYRMKLDQGKSHIKSYCGALMTLLLSFVILMYSLQKLDVFISKKDVDILSTVNDVHFDDDYVFDYDKGLNFAFAFTAYDDNPEPILNERIGRMQFNHFTWGAGDDGVFRVERSPIESHACTKEELGLEGDPTKATFLPVYESSLAEVEFFQKKLECVDTDEL